MWIVYNMEDSPECGYQVENREEAERICNNDPNMTSIYKG